MYYVYTAPLEDASAFKIGVSSDPTARVVGLSHYYTFALKSVRILECPSMEIAFQIETLLHNLCSASKVIFPFDGGTEFFDYQLLPQVLQVLDACSGLTGHLPVLLNLDPAKCAEVDEVAQTMNALANKIKAKRLSLNLKQEQIAEACEVTVQTYRRLERGDGSSITTLLKVLKALGMIDIIEAIPLNTGSKQRAS